MIRDFRNRMEERQQEAASRYGTIRALGTLCGVLSVAVLAGGVVLFGNYQKMREMESVLVSVLRMVCGALRTGKRRSRWNSSAAV